MKIQWLAYGLFFAFLEPVWAYGSCRNCPSVHTPLPFDRKEVGVESLETQKIAKTKNQLHMIFPNAGIEFSSQALARMDCSYTSCGNLKFKVVTYTPFDWTRSDEACINLALTQIRALTKANPCVKSGMIDTVNLSFHNLSQIPLKELRSRRPRAKLELNQLDLSIASFRNSNGVIACDFPQAQDFAALCRANRPLEPRVHPKATLPVDPLH